MTLEFIPEVSEESFGAVAKVITTEFKSVEAFNGVLLTMKYLQDGATLETIAEVLTQFATTITLKVGGKIAFKMSPTDLFNINQILADKLLLAHMTDGTGADNQFHTITLFIPFGLETELTKLEKKYGLDAGKNKVVLELAVPADGSKVDTRLLTVTAVTVKGSSPTHFVRRVLEAFSPKNANETQYVSLPCGNGEILVDITFWQTTSLGAGTIADTQTIEKVAIQENAKDVCLLDVTVEAFYARMGNLSRTVTLPAMIDNYINIPLGSEGNKYDGFKLAGKNRLRFTAGDTNATRLLLGILEKVPT